mmetsp:Transcript_39659/g.105622  ORF Transcript_39659/g.105622 Transcript_39659/m.105622 type:complete len:300 (-) Transcript_39659:79-978(-)
MVRTRLHANPSVLNLLLFGTNDRLGRGHLKGPTLVCGLAKRSVVIGNPFNLNPRRPQLDTLTLPAQPFTEQLAAIEFYQLLCQLRVIGPQGAPPSLHRAVGAVARKFAGADPSDVRIVPCQRLVDDLLTALPPRSAARPMRPRSSPPRPSTPLCSRRLRRPRPSQMPTRRLAWRRRRAAAGSGRPRMTSSRGPTARRPPPTPLPQPAPPRPRPPLPPPQPQQPRTARPQPQPQPPPPPKRQRRRRGKSGGGLRTERHSAVSARSSGVIAPPRLQQLQPPPPPRTKTAMPMSSSSATALW